MVTEEELERLVERFVERTQQANSYFLKKIGENVKKFRKLTPTEAQQLAQMLKYGGSYEEIVNEMAKFTNLNVKEIDELFYEFAKKDQLFYKQFYQYRNIPYIPLDKNVALQRQVTTLSNFAKEELANLTKNSVIGYTLRNAEGNIEFLGLKETFNRVIDEAVLNVGQGVDTFDSAVFRILKELGTSGLKKVEFESGRSIRLDSMVRQYLQGALRNLHNENQKTFGKEFGSDGIEISVHLNPAPDHEEVQGRQFSNEEFNKFQNDIDAIDYNGKLFPAEFEGHDRRSISEYNCYHYIFSIVLGVSKPNYTNEQLQKIIDDNSKGFEIDGKHYTMYEGTQLQRKLETEIRTQKDLQIMGKASENEQLVNESQRKINELTTKYNELCNVSGLKRQVNRLRVSGYRKAKV